MRSARCHPPLTAPPWPQPLRPQPPASPRPPSLAGQPSWLWPFLATGQPHRSPRLGGIQRLGARPRVWQRLASPSAGQRGPGRWTPGPWSSGRWSSGRRVRCRLGQGRDRGFILPLAFGASLVLLLGSLSLQSLVLQRRLGLLREEQRGHQEDALASAAQQLVAVLNRDHPCLLLLPRQRWGSDGLPCASPEQQQALVQGAGGGPWRLIDWQPRVLRAEALIEVDSGSPALPPRRGSFAVPLQEEPLQGQAPRLLALRAVAP